MSTWALTESMLHISVQRCSCRVRPIISNISHVSWTFICSLQCLQCEPAVADVSFAHLCLEVIGGGLTYYFIFRKEYGGL